MYQVICNLRTSYKTIHYKIIKKSSKFLKWILYKNRKKLSKIALKIIKILKVKTSWLQGTKGIKLISLDLVNGNFIPIIQIAMMIVGYVTNKYTHWYFGMS